MTVTRHWRITMKPVGEEVSGEFKYRGMSKCVSCRNSTNRKIETMNIIWHYLNCSHSREGRGFPGDQVKLAGQDVVDSGIASWKYKNKINNRKSNTHLWTRWQSPWMANCKPTNYCKPNYGSTPKKGWAARVGQGAFYRAVTQTGQTYVGNTVRHTGCNEAPACPPPGIEVTKSKQGMKVVPPLSPLGAKHQ